MATTSVTGVLIHTATTNPPRRVENPNDGIHFTPSIARQCLAGATADKLLRVDPPGTVKRQMGMRELPTGQFEYFSEDRPTDYWTVHLSVSGRAQPVTVTVRTSDDQFDPFFHTLSVDDYVRLAYAIGVLRPREQVARD